MKSTKGLLKSVCFLTAPIIFSCYAKRESKKLILSFYSPVYSCLRVGVRGNSCPQNREKLPCAGTFLYVYNRNPSQFVHAVFAKIRAKSHFNGAVVFKQSEINIIIAGGNAGRTDLGHLFDGFSRLPGSVVGLGKRHGVTGVLVLSGETTPDDVDAAAIADKPDFVFPSLDEVDQIMFG